MLSKLFALAVAGVMIAGVTIAQAAQPDIDNAQSASKYIKTLQNADGGFPAFGVDSSAGSTLDATFALVSAGYDVTRLQSNAGNSPDDYLSTQAASYSSDPGAAAKLSLGVSDMGLDPSNFGGVNLLSIMNANFNSGTGVYGLDLFDEAFYMLALEQAGQTVPAAASSYLASIQQPDRGWEFAPGFGSDTNTAAMVVEALIGAGMATSNAVVTDAIGYLASAQNADGGFGFVPGIDSDPDTTAVIVQALVAANQNLDDSGPFAPGGNTALEGLLAFRNAANGAFQFFGSDSAFATYQAVPALMLGAFPSVRPPVQADPTDTDGDGCPDEKEKGPDERLGGRRNYLNPWDYFDPTHDHMNRVDDILKIVHQFFKDGGNPAYNVDTDRTLVGPNAWNLGKPNGQQRVDDILAELHQFFHDCS
jgi:hypothetical protein